MSAHSHPWNSEFEDLATPDLIALILGTRAGSPGPPGPGSIGGNGRSGRTPGAPGASIAPGTPAAGLLGGLDLIALSRAAPSELAAQHGVGQRPARRLAAAFTLARRLGGATRPMRPTLRSAERVFRLLADDLRGLEQETFVVCLLDGKHALKRTLTVSVGTLTTSLVHPREVFRPALRAAAGAVVCAHNHPSGDPEPSAEDLQITRRLVQAGKLLGVPVLDHVVIGDSRYVSLRERLGF